METRTYRADAGSYAVLGAIAGLLCGLWVLIVLRVGWPWQPVAVPVVGFLLGALWLTRFRVTFRKDEVILSSPFRGPRRLALEDILSIEFASESTPGDSPFVLAIRTSLGEELRFNARVFSSMAVQHLLSLSPRYATSPQSSR